MTDLSIKVSIAQQTLQLFKGEHSLALWPISSAEKGTGNAMGSNQTPLGKHRIRACIGHGQPMNAVFVGRRPTGEIYSPQLAQQYPNQDWILSRILWLCGEEKGVNRGGTVDSQRRYIYIHGTPDSEPMGTPESHGCIRMRNTDVIALFNQVQPGTPVVIA